ncbi:MAG: HAD-IA family hydrolase [Planctomycetes bacterium]|nr:HAD-IA family hydrolase [Planctomycetota bacterium]
MSAVSAVMFDLGGVLCRVDEAAVWRAWEERTGVAAAELQRELFDRGLKQEFDRGLKAPGGVARFLAARFDIRLDLAAWRDIWSRSVEADPEMDALAARVAARLPCLLASTTDAIHHEVLASQLGCLARFAGQAVSYRLGSVKPEPEFYRRAIFMLGAPAGSTLFVDDRPENVEGARRCGLQAVQFTGRDALRAELAARGLADLG